MRPPTPAHPPTPAWGTIPYGKLLRWGWTLISWGRGWFFLSVVLTLLVQVLWQFNVKVLEGTLSLLQDRPITGLAAAVLPSGKIAVAGVFAGVGALIVVLTVLSRAASLYCDNLLGRRLQQSLHDKLLSLGAEYHQRHQQGELAAIVMNFSAGAEMMLTGLYATPLIRGLSLATGGVFLLDSLQKARAIPLGLQVALLAALVALPILGWMLAARLRGAYVAVRQKQIALSDELMNSLSNPVEVQVLAAQPQRSLAFARRLGEYFSSQFRASLRNEVSSQFQASTVLILQVLFVFSAAWYASRAPQDGAMVTVSILGFLLLIPSVVAPLQEIVSFVTGLQRSWPAVEVVLGVLEAPPAIEDRPGAAEIALTQPPSIELRGVSFSYEPGLPRILDQVSCVFRAGEVTAIVARSGQGKSTVLNLVSRLRDAQEGQVLIDGRDLREFQAASVRRGLAKASQFPLFIVDTVRANFQLAKPGATDEELRGLCQETGLWEVLRKASPSAPLDYVLPRSEGLSGGERRLLNVTRSLLHRPKALLLDEPTTGLDATARQELGRCLHQVCGGMTVLLADHDMNFVRDWANQVFVLELGHIVEQGAPRELLESPDSAFRRLWMDHNAEGSGDHQATTQEGRA